MNGLLTMRCIYFFYNSFALPQVSLEYLIPAMLISAPATFAISKVMVPETKDLEEENANETYSLMDEEKT